jgi:cystathionine gamma-lyase/cystathionine beta-lyase/cystathionine gamma-lyase/homocysteine desulfhydrase
MGFLTDSIHAGQSPDPATNAVSVPIYQTSTYAHESLGKTKGWGYARGDNPTREALERNLAALEHGRHALAFASGMAATTAVMSLLSQGDHTVSTAVVYGGTYRLFATVLERYGLSFTYTDTGDLEKVKASFRPSTKLVFVESPTNPLLTLSDIAAVSRLAHERGALVCVDNTFLSPYFQRPLDLGADLVVHSTTKYLNGHSDSVGGVVVMNDPDLQARLKHYQKSAGGILSPHDSFLVLRGTKTLGLRMRQHDANAMAIARHLAAHPRVLKVYYPGLPSHPQHALARTQQSGFGGMLAFELGDFAAAERLLNRVKLCTLAESLGGVETLISHPATMTHGAIPKEERLKLGITDGLVRLSAGCEDGEDLIADLDQALQG